MCSNFSNFQPKPETANSSTIQRVTLTTEDGTPLDVLEQEGGSAGQGTEALSTLQVGWLRAVPFLIIRGGWQDNHNNVGTGGVRGKKCCW